HRQGALAFEFGGVVSAPDSPLSNLAGRGGCSGVDADHSFTFTGASPALSCRRLVLVHGQPRSDDWVGAGWRAFDRRSFCLHSLCWTVFYGGLAGGRLG